MNSPFPAEEFVSRRAVRCPLEGDEVALSFVVVWSYPEVAGRLMRAGVEANLFASDRISPLPFERRMRRTRGLFRYLPEKGDDREAGLISH